MTGIDRHFYSLIIKCHNSIVQKLHKLHQINKSRQKLHIALRKAGIYDKGCYFDVLPQKEAQNLKP